MKNVKIRESLGVGWTSFTKRPWYLIGLLLAVFALFAALGSNAIIAALSAVVYGGYIALMLKHHRGETIVFDDLFDIDNRWIYFAFLFVIKTFLIMLGFFCFIIPGIYLSVRWMFAEILVIDQGLKPLAALKASSALTEGVRWKLFFFSLVGTLLVIAGVFLLIIGAAVAVLVVFFAMIHVYETLRNSELKIEQPNI